MKTYNNVIQLFANIAGAHEQVHSFGAGEVWDVDAAMEANQVMPKVWVVPGELSVADNIMLYNLTVLCFDLVQKDESNKQDVLSDTQLILLDILKVLRNEQDSWFTLDGDPRLNPFEERFQEDVAGWRMDLVLQVDFANNDCDMPMTDFVIPGSESGGGGGIPGGCCEGNPNEVLYYGADGLVTSDQYFSRVSNGETHIDKQYTTTEGLTTAGLVIDEIQVADSPVLPFVGAKTVDDNYTAIAGIIDLDPVGDPDRAPQSALIAVYNETAGLEGKAEVSTFGFDSDGSMGVEALVEDTFGTTSLGINGSGFLLSTNNGTDPALSFNSNGTEIGWSAGTDSFKLPLTHGTNGQVLTEDGTGSLSWTTVSGGGGGTIGGTAVINEVAYGSAPDTLTSDSNFTRDVTTKDTRIFQHNGTDRAGLRINGFTTLSSSNDNNATRIGTRTNLDHTMLLGDFDGTNNKTTIKIDDTGQNVTVEASQVFAVQTDDTLGQTQWLVASPSNYLVGLGDMSIAYNQTTLELYDDLQTVAVYGLDSAPTTSGVTFTGTGNNDATIDSGYNGQNGITLTLTITGNPGSYDTFSYVGMRTNTGEVIIAGNADTSSPFGFSSATVTWGAPTGHDIGDEFSWSFTRQSGRMLSLQGQDRQMSMGDINGFVDNSRITVNNNSSTVESVAAGNTSHTVGPNYLTFVTSNGTVQSFDYQGNQIIWDADPGDGVQDRFFQHQDIGAQGIKGTEITHLDNSGTQSASLIVGDFSSVSSNLFEASLSYTDGTGNTFNRLTVNENYLGATWSNLPLFSQFRMDNTGNTLSFKADTGTDLESILIQSANIFGAGISGVGISHRDIVTEENVVCAVGDFTATGGTPFTGFFSYNGATISSTLTVADQGLNARFDDTLVTTLALLAADRAQIGIEDYAGTYQNYHVMNDNTNLSYFEQLVDHNRGFIRLTANGNRLEWDADTTDTITTAIDQTQSFDALGISGTFAMWKDTSTDILAAAGAGDFTALADQPGTACLIAVNTDTLDRSAVTTNYNVSDDTFRVDIVSVNTGGTINSASTVDKNGATLSWTDATTTSLVAAGPTSATMAINQGGSSHVARMEYNSGQGRFQVKNDTSGDVWFNVDPANSTWELGNLTASGGSRFSLIGNTATVKSSTFGVWNLASSEYLFTVDSSLAYVQIGPTTQARIIVDNANEITNITGVNFFVQAPGGTNHLAVRVNQKRVTLDDARLEAAKGADVAGANDLTLSNGNTIVITGNTQINAITTANWQAGSQIVLVFTGTPTVKHNTAGGPGTAVIKLAGSVDLVAAADTVLGLVYDGTQWQEMFRKVA